MKNPFEGRWALVPKNGGYHMPGYYVWCGSAVVGEDGKYHLFASCWEEKYGFGSNWLLRCKIAHAVSETPEGPYAFHSFVFEERDFKYFDARNQHNPSIKYHDGVYYLYYFGTTFGGEIPAEDGVIDQGRFVEIWNNKRIGVATATSVYGPWKRPDEPLMQPRNANYWDCTCTTNPSVAIMPNGKSYMIYKSRRSSNDPLQLGVAVADKPDGPYERLSDEPIFQFENPSWFVEDPFMWYENGRFCLLMKDDFRDESGGITGEWGCGVYAESEDCLHWQIADQPKAYSRTLQWDDGTTTVQGHLERPNLLFQNGKPTHLFAATAASAEPWKFKGTSWSVCMPLKDEE
ncbi:MAG: glycoside hydrolase family protein [Faecalibacterium sp.]